MSKTVEISKIVIKIGNAEIALTPDEARELRDVLDETFGGKEKEYISFPVYPYPAYPHRRYWWDPVWISDTATLTISASKTDSATSVPYSVTNT